MSTPAESSQHTSESLAERSRAQLVRGRERVLNVLEPHLGHEHALERANNIAQALAVEDAEPAEVAFEMLRQLPSELRRKVAHAVQRAWLTELEPSAVFP